MAPTPFSAPSRPRGWTSPSACPEAPSFPCRARSHAARPCATSPRAAGRAPATWRRDMRAHPAAWASRSPRRARERRISSRRSRMRGWTRRRSCASPGRCAPTSSAATRSRSATSPGSRSRLSSTRGSCRTWRSCRTSSRPPSTWRAPDAAGPCSSTSRATSRKRFSTSRPPRRFPSRDGTRHADIPVVGPLKPVLAEMARILADARRPGATEPWLRQIAEWRDTYPLRYRNDGELLKPQLVLETLQRLTAGRDDVVFTTGVGQHQMWAMQYLRCDVPRSFITSGGLGTMGYGVPAAVGAKAARPDATVVCVDGDGCFQMTQQELATSVLEDLPIVVVIVNNGYLRMVRQWQDMFFEERFSQIRLTHTVPDYAGLARAYGAEGFTAENDELLESALQEALDSGRTAVVDARVDQSEHCFPMIPSGAAALDVLEYEDDVEAVPAA